MKKQYFTLIEPEDKDEIFQKLLSGRRILVKGAKQKDLFMALQMLDTMQIKPENAYSVFEPYLKETDVKKIISVGAKQKFPAIGNIFGIQFAVFEQEEDADEAAKMLQFVNDRYRNRGYKTQPINS